MIGAYDRQRHEDTRRPSVFIELDIVDLSGRQKPKKKTEVAEAKARKRKDAALARLEAHLEKALGPKWWNKYCLYARAYIQRDIYGANLQNHWPQRFNSIQVRRWVCKRAHDLGWTPERFAAFDDRVRYVDRHTHSLERLGKKYQWIALHEALAHLADNAAYIGDHRERLSIFQGPWETGTRDIDPSLLATKTFDDTWKQWGPTWWMPAKTHLLPVSAAERLIWLDTAEDVWTDPYLIAVSEPENGRSWFVLEESVAWYQWGLNRGDRIFERRAFFAVNCLLVRTSDRKKLIDSLSGRIRYGNHDLPSVGLPYGAYIGEHFWHPMHATSDGWAEADGFTRIPVATQPMDAEYSAKRGEYDYSLADSFTVKMPALGLAMKLGLRLSDGKRMSYANGLGQIVFFDPATTEPGPRASLVERASFVAFLEEEKLEAVWIVASNKEVFGSKRHDGGWGGERAKCSLYWLTKNGFARKDYEERKEPSADQLEKFWGEEGGAKPVVKGSKEREKSVRPRKAVAKKSQDRGKRHPASRRSRPAHGRKRGTKKP